MHQKKPQSIFKEQFMAVQITKKSDDYSVAPQLSVEDVAEIAAAGFKTIINFRPDN